MKDAFRIWPARRWLAAMIAFPVMLTLFGLVDLAGSSRDGTSWWMWPWLILTGVLAAITLASYLAPPGARKLIEVGCSPCAAMAATAVAAAVIAHASAPASPFMAIVALALTAFAVRQRLADARTCPTSSDSAPPGSLPSPR